jgi:hypothetical protein
MSFTLSKNVILKKIPLTQECLEDGGILIQDGRHRSHVPVCYRCPAVHAHDVEDLNK